MNNIIQGKKINFNEEISNLNLIQNKNNSIIYKSALNEGNKSSSFLFPSKPTSEEIPKNSSPIPNPLFPLLNKSNIPPKNFPSNQNLLNKINNDNIIINGTKLEKNNIINQINRYSYKNIPKIICTCTRTQCQKKYCACFSHGIPCQGCECKGCLNTPKIKNQIDLKEENNNLYQDNKLIQGIVCNCTKSHCLKKYCECYKMSQSCGNLCRCVDCQNKNIFVNNNENIVNNILNEEEDNYDEINNYNGNNIENFQEINETYGINAFGIYIYNNKLIIKERYVDLTTKKINLNTTPKLTNKKRSRTKNENSNLRTCPTTNSNSRRRRRTHTEVNTNVKTKKLIIN